MTDSLNLGCGKDTMEDATNVDCVKLAGVDDVVDLNAFPWPWPDDSIETIYASHIFEHLDEPIQAMQECARILRQGGFLEWTYPIGQTRFEDPQHQHYWNYHTAATIVGERKHAHEHVSGLSLITRDVSYSVGSRAWRAYTRLRERVCGPGPWLSQIPGLSGEVTASYRKS